jgi:hypothetical protein
LFAHTVEEHCEVIVDVAVDVSVRRRGIASWDRFAHSAFSGWSAAKVYLSLGCCNYLRDLRVFPDLSLQARQAGRSLRSTRCIQNGAHPASELDRIVGLREEALVVEAR